MSGKTIAAISTPQGSGGIGVIRVSGEKAIEISDKVFVAKSNKKLASLKGYSALYGNVFDNGEAIDEAVALVFLAPHSYTGEDVVEISCHGGPFVLRKTLRALFSNGAVPAQAGEFTKRAFLNGKMDLIEAEAVMGIISAEGETSRRSAFDVHEGRISKEVNEIKEELLLTAAGLSVYCDYPDDELPEFSEDTLKGSLKRAKSTLETLLKNYDVGKVIREGVDTVICGKPNVGKSTLMNILVGSNRSIVTSIAGTTRDVVEESVTLGDIKLRLSDTAGLRETDDEVEKIGVGISKKRIESAALIIAVFDGSQKESEQDLLLLDICKKRPSVVILNKDDLKREFNQDLLLGLETVITSFSDPSAIEKIKSAVEKIVGISNLHGDETFLCTERQRSATESAYNSIVEALDIMQSGVTLDAVGVLIDEAIASILSLTGEKVTQAVVDKVFENFCVGK